MTAVRIALVAAALALAALIVWASARADIWQGLATVAADPWGLVALGDLYLGFIVAGIIVAMAERPLAALAWFVALLVLGNIVSAVWLAWRMPRLVFALRSPR